MHPEEQTIRAAIRACSARRETDTRTPRVDLDLQLADFVLMLVDARIRRDGLKLSPADAPAYIRATFLELDEPSLAEMFETHPEVFAGLPWARRWFPDRKPNPRPFIERRRAYLN